MTQGQFTGERRRQYVQALADARLWQGPNDIDWMLGRIRQVRDTVAATHERQTMESYYRPEQAILSAPWPPYVLEGAQGLRKAVEELAITTLSELAGTWHTRNEKLRQLLGNAPSKVAAVKAMLAKVGKQEGAPETAASAPAAMKPPTPRLALSPTAATPKPATPPQPTANVAQPATWPPQMPVQPGESAAKAATRVRKNQVLALTAQGKTNGQVEKALGLCKNYVANSRKDPVFLRLLEQARAGTPTAEDPQAVAVTDKLPPRPAPVKAASPVPAHGPEPEPEVDDPHHESAAPEEDGPADHLAAQVPPRRFQPRAMIGNWLQRAEPRTFAIPLDGTRDATLSVPGAVSAADIEAIGEYLAFLGRRLQRERA